MGPEIATLVLAISGGHAGLVFILVLAIVWQFRMRGQQKEWGS